MSEWADHLLWFEDGRFAKHPVFKFVVHNMIMRKRALESSTFVFNQKLGDKHLTVDDLKEKLKNGDIRYATKFFILVLLYVGQVNIGLKEQENYAL